MVYIIVDKKHIVTSEIKKTLRLQEKNHRAQTKVLDQKIQGFSESPKQERMY